MFLIVCTDTMNRSNGKILSKLPNRSATQQLIYYVFFTLLGSIRLLFLLFVHLHFSRAFFFVLFSFVGDCIFRFVLHMQNRHFFTWFEQMMKQTIRRGSTTKNQQSKEANKSLYRFRWCLTFFPTFFLWLSFVALATRNNSRRDCFVICDRIENW